MAKQERRLFDGDAQVWVQSYKNLHNVAHWHFENELAVCQRGSAEVMLDGVTYTLGENSCVFLQRETVTASAARRTAASRSRSSAGCSALTTA